MSAKIIQKLSEMRIIALDTADTLEAYEIDGETRDSKCPVTHLKTLLRKCSSEKLKDSERILYGKAACETMHKRAARALENGGKELSAYFMHAAMRLSKPVSFLLNCLEDSNEAVSAEPERLEREEEAKGENG